MDKELFDLETLLKYVSIFVSGTLFLLFLVYISINEFFNFYLKYILLFKNDYVVTLIFLVISFGLGSYFYLFGLRIYSYFFGTVLDWKMDQKENTPHLYWRHFFISLSFTLGIILMIYLTTSINSFLRILFLLFIFSVIMTYLLHKELIGKKENESMIIKKSFEWDYQSVNKNYYSIDGLKVIVIDQKNTIEKPEKR